ncbi:hypothetical protein [Caballeronia terrestris]|uniref:hypothetical protein n=1 Tax=Caballeronia terrestris TaxID=1226301 RepID=UPI000A919815|nr:hypothetical protein [Caballeronia terrestris]
MARILHGAGFMMPNDTLIARAPTTPRTIAAWRAYAHLRRTLPAAAGTRRRQRPIISSAPKSALENRPNRHERALCAFPAHF